MGSHDARWFCRGRRWTFEYGRPRQPAIEKRGPAVPRLAYLWLSALQLVQHFGHARTYSKSRLSDHSPDKVHVNAHASYEPRLVVLIEV
jgi:hypothetical protein